MKGHRPPTAAELKRLFSERGIRANRGRGQNFLVDVRAMRFVAEAANLGPADVVLEPGPGTGGLTGLLAERAGAVIAVELDRKLHALARENLAGFPNVTVLHADIMARGGGIAPDALEAVEVALSGIAGGRLKVVSNLPYRVSTAFIAAMFRGERVPDDMVVTVQREVADRLLAEAGAKDYGYLSVVVQALAEIRKLRKLPPGAFWPPPEVDSAVVRITPRRRRPDGETIQALERIVSALFTHRRKKAASGLYGTGMAKTRDEARALLEKVGASPDARPEDLTVGQFIELAAAAHRP